MKQATDGTFRLTSVDVDRSPGRITLFHTRQTTVWESEKQATDEIRHIRPSVSNVKKAASPILVAGRPCTGSGFVDSPDERYGTLSPGAGTQGPQQAEVF